jgi:Protein of unknown function (DUF3106)
MPCLIKASKASFAKKTTRFIESLNVFLNVIFSQKRSPSAVKRMRSVALFAALGSLAIVAAPASAQKWSELSAQEQKNLAPFQKEWDNMSAERKKKWRTVAEKQQAMPPEQRDRVQQRMQNWSQLSPDERKKARAGFEDLKQLPPEKRAAVPQKWDEYRNLPPEKQEELRKKAAAERATK